MQAPLGLNAYVPAVLDPDPAEGLPDEVALIVYASLDIYQKAREHSLRRRMYTHSHAAVFDMRAPGCGGQFPGSLSELSTREDRVCWHVLGNAVDWQSGVTQLIFSTPETGAIGEPDSLRTHTGSKIADLEAATVDQLICVATPKFAVLWVHAASEIDALALDLLSPDYSVVKRHLSAQPVLLPHLDERVEILDLDERVKITDASMYTFRFVRELRYHL